MSVEVIVGDCREVLAGLAANSVQTCVTSPPYFGLRDYGVAGQIGLEASVEEYVAQLVAVFREVRRVLRDDGTLWLNLGDSYASPGGVPQPHRDTNGGYAGSTGKRTQGYALAGGGFKRPSTIAGSVKPKDLIGVPWRVAFALQADGWYLRSDIIWHKPNPMPESVTDRPTKAHEYLFLLSKSPRYYYDAAAIAEASLSDESYRPRTPRNADKRDGDRFFQTKVGDHANGKTYETRNRRTVWTVATRPFSGAHFATFPPHLIEPCIKAGSRPGDTILDPFGGAGTSGLVANRLGRHAVLIELNPEYATMAKERIHADAPLFAEGAA